jgi:Tol biopolymer transport system component
MRKITRLSLLLLCFSIVLSASDVFSQSWRSGKVTFWQYNEHNFCIMNADGSDVTKLTDNDTTKCYLTYSLSPDCKKVALVLRKNWDPDSNYDIAILDIDTHTLINLTNGKIKYSTSPRWSPDGKKIVFQGFDNNIMNTQIYIINSDGTELKMICDGQLPDWSPDGKRIAFLSGADIYVMDIDGKANGIIKDQALSGYLTAPRWSPDGAKILFATVERSNNGDITTIYTIDSDGRNLKMVKKDIDLEKMDIISDCCWSPDGQRIAFVAVVQNEWWHIWVMDLDGNNMERLTNYHLSELHIDWRDPSSVAVKPLKTIQTTWAWIKQGR